MSEIQQNSVNNYSRNKESDEIKKKKKRKKQRIHHNERIRLFLAFIALRFI